MDCMVQALELKDLDRVIRKSLGDFLRGIEAKHWVGRENEAVNLYVFSYLLKEVSPNCFLHNPAQIGLEVAVQQISDYEDGKKHRKTVRKDLVIWDKPETTCWNNKRQITNHPSVIIEWKLCGFRKAGKNALKNSALDLLWLQKFSKNREDFIGYAVTVDITDQKYMMMVTKITHGNKEAEWLLGERR